MKEKATTMRRKRITDDQLSRETQLVYQQRYHPNFHCAHEKRIGKKADGGKWVCDPHRISEQKLCLIYSVGSNGDYSFERAIKKSLSPHCEIHTFDFGDYREGAIQSGSNYHQWGISNVNEGRFKTLERTIEELGHVGRTIDVFKIDCEGCEWDTFQSWLSANVLLRQILVEVHHDKYLDLDKTKMFYNRLEEEGYVIFHREANIMHSFYGNLVRALEVAFLKLDKSFSTLT